MAYIKLQGYAKKKKKKKGAEGELSKAASFHTHLDDFLFLLKTAVTKTTALFLQHSISKQPVTTVYFIPAVGIYQSRPALIHVPASTLTVVDLTRPCCHTLQGQIVPLAHCELYTSLLQCFTDLRCFSVFKIERLSVPALCSLHV